MVVWSGITALALAVSLGFLVAYCGYRIFDHIAGSMSEEQELARGNIAAAILSGAFILALGYVLRSVIHPLNQTFFNVLYRVSEGDAGAGDVLQTLAVMALQLLAALAVAGLTVVGSVRVFTWLTQIDEFQQIRDGNVAVAIVVAALAVTFALLFEEGVSALLQVIIPAPEIQNDLLRPFG